MKEVVVKTGRDNGTKRRMDLRNVTHSPNGTGQLRREK